MYICRKWLLSTLKKTLEGIQNPTPHNIGEATANASLSNPKPDPTSYSQIPHSPQTLPMTSAVRDVVNGEMTVCKNAAEKYANNYNAWNHRIWVHREFTGCHPEILTAELDHMRSWVSSHVSDHSGFHYRQFLLNNVCPSDTETSDIHLGTLLRNEIVMTTDLILTFSGHEAIWYHR